MFDNLFGKAYEAEGGASLSISPQLFMAIVTVVSLVYILYAISSITMGKNALFYYEKYIFPVMNFYLLGCSIGQSGYGCIFGVVDGTNDGSDKIKYTIHNIKDWHFAKYLLIAGVVCLLFIFVVQILLARNTGHFIRDVVFMLSLSVFGFCVARYAMTVKGFLLKLLFLPTSALAFFCQFMWIIALFLWFMPTSAIAAMNRSREEKEKQNKYAPVGSKQEESGDTSYSAHAARFPSSVTDDKGETWYKVSESGDWGEYECRKNGERKRVFYDGEFFDFPSGWNY